GLGATVALGRFREGGQQRAARDLGLDGFPLSGGSRLKIALICCRHGYNPSSPAARTVGATSAVRMAPPRQHMLCLGGDFRSGGSDHARPGCAGGVLAMLAQVTGLR